MSLRVTIEDTEAGTVETTVIAPGDYRCIVAEPCYVDRITVSGTTHVLVIRDCKPQRATEHQP